MRVRSVGIQYHIASFHILSHLTQQRRHIHRHITLRPVGYTSHIPRVPFPARRHDIFSHLSVQHSRLIPHRRHSRHKTGIVRLFLIICRGIAQHVQRRFQHHIERQLMATCPLTHRFAPTGMVTTLCPVVHSTLRIIHRTRRLTYKRNLRVVLHLIPTCRSPFHLL